MQRTEQEIALAIDTARAEPLGQANAQTGLLHDLDQFCRADERVRVMGALGQQP
ncbi:hypothetical protein KIN_09740 [Litoreibacter roseus]|uniref:Uncharacterized protein n=1 Tax=Litoreibacter roseus TaxID=2601869 RepID=A0A6N6JDJ2_9RHOB|nr:hypothetical protein KIN_09740 [Litoreibacter roseus]